MPTFPDLRPDRATKADSTAVRYLQTALNSQGYHVTINGKYDATTQAAVLDFQGQHIDSKGRPLEADAWVGAMTWWAIQNPSGAAQRNNIEADTAKGLSPLRRKILATAFKDHAAGTHEIPDGSNYGDGVTRYLVGVGPAFWCFTGDQEILTQEYGWVRLDHLNADHGAVAQVDDKLEMTFALPSAYIAKHHQGDVITSTQKKGPQFTCDSEHRFFGFQGSVQKALSKPQFRTIGTITQDFQIPPCRKSTSEVDVSEDDMELLGAFLADGCAENGTSITFLVQRARKIERLRQGFGHNKPKERDEKAADGDARKCFTFARPEFFTAAFESYKKLNHSFVSALNSAQAEACLRGFQAFDGSQCTGDGLWVHAAREHHADLLLTLGVIAGYHPKYGNRIQPENSFSTGSVLHWVRMNKARKTLTLCGDALQRSKKEVMLYCVTVPEGRIVVRGANKVPFMTGNCSFAVSTWFKDVTGEYPYGKHQGSVKSFWDQAKKNGRQILKDKTNTPVPGDAFVMLYRNSSGSLTGLGHIGLVVAASIADNVTFNTVEGNAGNRVKIGQRSVEQSTLVGYIDLFGDREDVRLKFKRGLLTQAEKTDSSLASTR